MGLPRADAVRGRHWRARAGGGPARARPERRPPGYGAAGRGRRVAAVVERPAGGLDQLRPRARDARRQQRPRERLCGRDQAARSACPASSRIGFGRFIVAVRGYLSGGGETELTWCDRRVPGQTASPRGRGIGRADRPAPGRRQRHTTSRAGTRHSRPEHGDDGRPARPPGIRRVRRRASLRKLPVQLDVAAPITATPARLELSLSAVRRIRQDFIRRIRVRTLSGYEVRTISDHRLIGHHLLRTPRSCNGSWPAELRVGFSGLVKRTASRIACTNP